MSLTPFLILVCLLTLWGSLLAPHIFAASSPAALAHLRRPWSRAELLAFLDRWRLELLAEISKNSGSESPRSSEGAMGPELRAELDWVYLLQFEVDRRYDGTEASLLRILSFLQELYAGLSATDPSVQVFRIFLDHLMEAVSEIREPSEPLHHFIKSYTKQSTVLNPMNTEDYGDERPYFNLMETSGAHEMSLDEWIHLEDPPMAQESVPQMALEPSSPSSNSETPENPSSPTPDQIPSPLPPQKEDVDPNAQNR